jgi:hypothetical protein
VLLFKLQDYRILQSQKATVTVELIALLLMSAIVRMARKAIVTRTQHGSLTMPQSSLFAGSRYGSSLSARVP